MAKANEDILHAPPFPPLVWDDYAFWEGPVAFQSWPDYLSTGQGEGEVKVYLWAEGERALPTETQVAAFRYVLENGKTIIDSIIHHALPYLRSDLPSEEIRGQVWMRRMCLYDVDSKGIAYVCFEIVSPGYGDDGALLYSTTLLMHRDRVVEVGDEYMFFESWIAREDARGE